MPRKIHKSFHDYLPKFRINPTPNIQVFSSTHSLSASLSRILSRCKYPKTPSFIVSGDRTSGQGATLSDIDRFLFENFRSLYPKFDDHDDTKKQEEGEEEEQEEENPGGGIMFESPRILDPPSNINFSERFFSAPGFSSSLMEDSGASLTATSEDFPSSYAATTPNINLDRFSSSCNDKKESSAPHECIAVLMNSQNPYLEFRMSMQEMIEARLQRNEKADWDFMEDLLFCYLNLNDKASHKHILQAFVDLINDFGRKTDPSFHDSPQWDRMEKEIKKVNVKFQSSSLH